MPECAPCHHDARSPFTSRFNTNYAPSPQEIEEIKQIIHEPEKKLCILDAEIAKLQAQRDVLKTFIDNHRSLLSPIRRVPADILGEIFVQCLPHEHLPCRNLQEAPLLLTGICQAWRKVVISTPRLWNRIHISLPYPNASPISEAFHSLMKMRIEGLHMWLGRSGTMPLTISLCGRVSMDFGAWQTADQSRAELATLYLDFTRHLLAYSVRWRSVSLKVPRCIWDLLRTYESEQLNALQGFRAIIPDPSWIASEGLPVRWETLTELALSPCISVSKAVQLSRACKSLRRCSVRIAVCRGYRVDDSLGQPSSEVLQHLHTLNLLFDPELISEEMSLFFDSVAAVPVLKHLSISLAGYIPVGPNFDVSPLLRFVERSRCVLLSLQLSIAQTDDRLIDLLRLMPSLSDFAITSLRVTWDSSTNTHLTKLVQELTPDPTHSDVLCPHLETVTFVSYTPADANPFLALAEARCQRENDRVRMLQNMTVALPCVLQTSPGISSRLETVRNRVRILENTVFLDLPYVLQTSPGFSSRLETLRDRGMVIRWLFEPPERSFYDEPSVLSSDLKFQESDPVGKWEQTLYKGHVYDS